MLSSKLAQAGVWGGGGGGRGSPIYKQNVRMMGFCQASLRGSKKRKVWGGGRGAALPHLQTQRSHDGFQKRLICCKDSYGV